MFPLHQLAVPVSTSSTRPHNGCCCLLMLPTPDMKIYSAVLAAERLHLQCLFACAIADQHLYQVIEVNTQPAQQRTAHQQAKTATKPFALYCTNFRSLRDAGQQCSRLLSVSLHRPPACTHQEACPSLSPQNQTSLWRTPPETPGMYGYRQPVGSNLARQLSPWQEKPHHRMHSCRTVHDDTML